MCCTLQRVRFKGAATISQTKPTQQHRDANNPHMYTARCPRVLLKLSYECLFTAMLLLKQYRSNRPWVDVLHGTASDAAMKMPMTKGIKSYHGYNVPSTQKPGERSYVHQISLTLTLINSVLQDTKQKLMHQATATQILLAAARNLSSEHNHTLDPIAFMLLQGGGLTCPGA